MQTQMQADRLTKTQADKHSAIAIKPQTTSGVHQLPTAGCCHSDKLNSITHWPCILKVSWPVTIFQECYKSFTEIMTKLSPAEINNWQQQLWADHVNSAECAACHQLCSPRGR